jgi:uncharacterized protein (TIGR03435 family)
LVLARSDGKLGPQLKRLDRDCATPATGCGVIIPGEGRLRASEWPWAGFVSLLEDFSGRPVADKTGLSGRFDITLEWNPGGIRAPLASDSQTSTEDRPVLFTALQDQLGLKLEPATEPFDVVVIERVERPAPN